MGNKSDFKNPFHFMVGRIVASKNVHLLIPRTHKYTTLYGKRDFANVAKEYPGEPSIITRVLKSERGRQEGQGQAADEIIKAEIKVMPALKVEVGQELRNSGSLQKLEKASKQVTET
jgi:hypothetical protein